jgi:hypothetical protein
MKVVINNSYGLFEISDDFYKHYNISRKERITRYDSRLIEFIEEFGWLKASGGYSHLEVVEIPRGAAYRIAEYDGAEYIEYRDEIEWLIAE